MHIFVTPMQNAIESFSPIRALKVAAVYFLCQRQSCRYCAFF